MYALNLDEKNGRILSATYPQYAPADAVTVETLPDGNIADYLYVDGKYVYDPTPEPSPDPVEPGASIEDRVAHVESEVERLAVAVDVELADADAALRELGAEWEEANG